MAKKELPEKMFYSITEVAQYYNVNESTLRFWEKEFDLIAPKRSDNKRKIRSYTAQDVQNIGLIYHLLKEQGLTLSGAKEKLRKKPGKKFTGSLVNFFAGFFIKLFFAEMSFKGSLTASSKSREISFFFLALIMAGFLPIPKSPEVAS